MVTTRSKKARDSAEPGEQTVQTPASTRRVTRSASRQNSVEPEAAATPVRRSTRRGDSAALPESTPAAATPASTRRVTRSASRQNSVEPEATPTGTPLRRSTRRSASRDPEVQEELTLTPKRGRRGSAARSVMATPTHATITEEEEAEPVKKLEISPEPAAKTTPEVSSSKSSRRRSKQRKSDVPAQEEEPTEAPAPEEESTEVRTPEEEASHKAEKEKTASPVKKPSVDSPAKEVREESAEPVLTIDESSEEAGDEDKSDETPKEKEASPDKEVVEIVQEVEETAEEPSALDTTRDYEPMEVDEYEEPTPDEEVQEVEEVSAPIVISEKSSPIKSLAVEEEEPVVTSSHESSEEPAAKESSPEEEKSEEPTAEESSPEDEELEEPAAEESSPGDEESEEPAAEEPSPEEAVEAVAVEEKEVSLVEEEKSPKKLASADLSSPPTRKKVDLSIYVSPSVSRSGSSEAGEDSAPTASEPAESKESSVEKEEESSPTKVAAPEPKEATPAKKNVKVSTSRSPIAKEVKEERKPILPIAPEDFVFDFKEAMPKIPKLKKIITNRKEFSEGLVRNLQHVYFLANSTVPNDDLPEQLMTFNQELIWQQVAQTTKHALKVFKKRREAIKKACEDLEEEENDENEEPDAAEFDAPHEDEEKSDEDEDIQFPGDQDEEGGADLFSLKPEDMKNIDKELAAMEQDDSDAEDDLKTIIDGKRKFAKTVVDDRLFSLRQMDAILDKVEKDNLTEGFLDDIDDNDDEGVATSYTYADLYDEKPDKRAQKRKAEKEEKLDKKKVRFADGDDEEEEEEMDDEEMLDEQDVEDEEEEQDAPVLLGAAAEPEKPLTDFEKKRQKMKEQAAKFEEQNLKPRSWELSGEVTATGRDANTLLSQHMQYDQVSRGAPEITVDHTETIEAMIKQRIKDKAFDDPVRKVKKDEKPERYRPELEELLEKKSLTQVYEEAYQKEQNKDNKEEKIDPKKKEIEDDMKALFTLFDALTHYEYTPPMIKPELKIVSNMRSMQKEEVGPMASTAADEMLVAPEEVTKPVGFDPKAEDERTKTDKLRDRRKKKLKQKKLVASGKTIIKKKISKKAKKEASVAEAASAEKKSKKVKSSAFFGELNAVAESEKVAKKTKKKRVTSSKVNASAKYKL